MLSEFQRKKSKTKRSKYENSVSKHAKVYLNTEFIEKVRFSQTNININKTKEIYFNMKSRGWFKENNVELHYPIDIVEMPDKKFTSYDNKRLFCAKILGVELSARIHIYTDYADINRVNPKQTWGKAIESRCRNSRNWSEEEKYGYENYPIDKHLFLKKIDYP